MPHLTSRWAQWSGQFSSARLRVRYRRPVADPGRRGWLADLAARRRLRRRSCARWQGSRLLAVYVGQIPASASAAPGGAAVMGETFEQIADELKQLMLGRTAETGIAAEFRSVRGDPLAELTRIAEQMHADTVVVGASEHLGHEIVGSLASRLVRAGKWPVTVVP